MLDLAVDAKYILNPAPSTSIRGRKSGRGARRPPAGCTTVDGELTCKPAVAAPANPAFAPIPLGDDIETMIFGVVWCATPFTHCNPDLVIAPCSFRKARRAKHMFALVDVNSFYASYETVFRPDLRGRPVVVVSNNDGCIVARSREAKACGIKMREPWFKFAHDAKRQGVVAFSSNYAN